jgi:uncharacterized protein (TIGR02646 family)
MIALSATITPGQATLDNLANYQQKVDGQPDFPAQRAMAKQLFKKYNKIGNRTFDVIKQKLVECCSGARRCVYCEDSVADEVEHIRPKDIYPDYCFRWSNYVYACRTCNGPKNNKFAVFRADNGAFEKVNPPRGTPAQPPVAGDPVLLDPRIEDPMAYCILDLKTTFKFVVLPHIGSRNTQRAKYTFEEVLRLNEREYLCKARKSAYGNYKARLAQYFAQKQSGATGQKLNDLIIGIQQEAHPTVWKEIQRYHRLGYLQSTDQELHQLFVAVPEALTW